MTERQQQLLEVILLALIVLIPRLGLAYLNRYALEADLHRYFQVAQLLDSGKNITTLPSVYYPYPPPWMWIEHWALDVSQQTELPFTLVIKIPLIVADLVLTFTLYALVGAKWALVYALNPLSVLITAAFGQFDALTWLPLIWSLVLVRDRRFFAAGLLGGAAVALKWYPVFIVGLTLLYLLRTRTVSYVDFAWYVAGGVLVFGVVLFPYLLNGQLTFVTRPILYASRTTGTDIGLMRLLKDVGLPIQGLGNGILPGIWGALLSRGKLLLACKLLLASVSLFALLRFRFATVQGYLFLFLIAFYTLAGGISAQYLLWIIPVGCWLKRRDVIVYSVIGTLVTAALLMEAYPALLSSGVAARTPVYSTLRTWTNVAFVIFCFGWLAKVLLEQPRFRTDPISA